MALPLVKPDMTTIDYANRMDWNNEQKRIIPFLLEQNIELGLFQKIMSQSGYYQGIAHLIDLQLTENLFFILEQSESWEILLRIEVLAHEEHRTVCYILWGKDALSLKEFENLAKALDNYPLLASTLLALDAKQTLPDRLKSIAFNAFEHLIKSIIHHFGDICGIKEVYLQTMLGKLDLEELKQAALCFSLLKNLGINEYIFYEQVLQKSHAGKRFRLFLPELSLKLPEAYRADLIKILYTACYGGIRSFKAEIDQLKRQKALKNSLSQGVGGNLRSKAESEHMQRQLVMINELILITTELYRRFKCVAQLQALELSDELIALALEQETEESRLFRFIIIEVDKQCNKIQAGFGFFTSDKIRDDWQQEQEAYRVALYQIAYDALKGNALDCKERLDRVTENILLKVDPPVESLLYKIILIVADFLTSLLTLTAANYLKKSITGNSFFFTQTRAGEQVRNLTEEIEQCLFLASP